MGKPLDAGRRRVVAAAERFAVGKAAAEAGSGGHDLLSGIQAVFDDDRSATSDPDRDRPLGNCLTFGLVDPNERLAISPSTVDTGISTPAPASPSLAILNTPDSVPVIPGKTPTLAGSGS